MIAVRIRESSTALADALTCAKLAHGHLLRGQASDIECAAEDIEAAMIHLGELLGDTPEKVSVTDASYTRGLESLRRATKSLESATAELNDETHEANLLEAQRELLITASHIEAFLRLRQTISTPTAPQL